MLDLNHIRFRPHGNIAKLIGQRYHFHEVVVSTFLLKVDEEVRSILKLLLRDVLVVVHDFSEVEFNVLLNERSNLLSIDLHKDATALVNVNRNTC